MFCYTFTYVRVRECRRVAVVRQRNLCYRAIIYTLRLRARISCPTTGFRSGARGISMRLFLHREENETVDSSRAPTWCQWRVFLSLSFTIMKNLTCLQARIMCGCRKYFQCWGSWLEVADSIGGPTSHIPHGAHHTWNQVFTWSFVSAAVVGISIENFLKYLCRYGGTENVMVRCSPVV